jgi:hypothetical protein
MLKVFSRDHSFIYYYYGRNNSLMGIIFPIIIGSVLVAGFYYLTSTSGPGNITFRELDRLITSGYN